MYSGKEKEKDKRKEKRGVEEGRGVQEEGKGRRRGESDRGEELKGIISEKMEVAGAVRGWWGDVGGGEGMLVEKGGAFDLKFRPGGNRGGVTHSNAGLPPTPPTTHTSPPPPPPPPPPSAETRAAVWML